jgi:hypothetical protein
MMLDDELRNEMEVLAERMNHCPWMGVCCYGEQGMVQTSIGKSEAMHANLMCSTMIFSKEPSALLRRIQASNTTLPPALAEHKALDSSQGYDERVL